MVIQPGLAVRSEDTKSIYFTSSSFHAYNCFTKNEQDIDEIFQELVEYPGTREYTVYNGNIVQILNNDYIEYTHTAMEYSNILNNKSVFNKVYDIQYLQNILDLFKREDATIRKVMCKLEYYNYKNYGYTNYFEAWLFTDDNIYILELHLNNDDIEINEVYTLEEWKKTMYYRPIGKCFFEDKCISEYVYFNEHEGSVPLRVLIENMGGSIEWNQDDYSANITYNDKKYKFKYLFMERGSDHGGVRIECENNKMIVAGRVSGAGTCFIKDDTTYLSMLTARVFLRDLGFSIIAHDNSVFVSR